MNKKTSLVTVLLMIVVLGLSVMSGLNYRTTQDIKQDLKNTERDLDSYVAISQRKQRSDYEAIVRLEEEVARLRTQVGGK